MSFSWKFAGLLGLLLATGWGVRYVMAESQLESPEYTVENRDGAFEFRSYPAYLVAEVSVSGARSQAANQGFEILAGYIFGANPPRQAPERAEKIAMTSPVTQIPESDGQWKVRFMMPRRFTLETLPTARDERIRFFYTKEERFVALRFSGDWSEANLVRHRSQLEQYATEHRLNSLGSPVYAFYNAPFVPPPLRRNEVLLKLPDR